MVYTQDYCPPRMIKSLEVLGKKQVSRSDPNPEVQRKLREIDDAAPTTLGPLDRLAAKKFSEDWNRRVAKAFTSPPKAKESLKPDTKKPKQAKLEDLHPDLMVTPVMEGGEMASSNWLGRTLDSFASQIERSCLELGKDLKDCKSYFPSQTRLVEPGNKSLFFSHNSLPTCEPVQQNLIAPQSTPKLSQ